MNNKKILAFMLSLAIVCPIGSTPMAELMPNITANAEASTPTTDESYFTFDDTTGTITGYNTAGGTDVVIPSTIGDVAVTSIGNIAFYNCTSLTSITIPDSVTSIGGGAFEECTALESINVDKLKSECENFSFPDDVTVNYAFALTNNLENITSDNSATKISPTNTSDYTATLTADEGYTLPEDVTIKVGDTTLTDGYTFVDGVLTINAEKVTGNITIEATAKLNEYKVTSDLTNITSNNEAKFINHDKEYKATLTAKDGYTLPEDVTIKVGDTTLTDGYTFVDGVLTIDAKKVTGNISITATAEKQFTSSDLLKLKRHILGISNIDDISSLDVNQDNKLNILDFLTIKNSILNQ